MFCDLRNLTPPNARAYESAWGRIPLAGLGLALSEAERGGVPDAAFLAALASVTLPPGHDLGLRFPAPTAADLPCRLPSVFAAWREGRLAGAPAPDCPALAGLRSYWQLAFCLPVLDLPAGQTAHAWEVHVLQLLNFLAGRHPGAEAPPSPDEDTPRRPPLPFSPASPRGPVTPAHVRRFAAAFPGIIEGLLASIARGADEKVDGRVRVKGPGGALTLAPDAAVAAVERLTGLRADPRRGWLMPEPAVNRTVLLAGGIEVDDLDEPEQLRLWHFVDRTVPRARPTEVTRHEPGLRGAAWSCDVDAALNGPAAWTPRNRWSFCTAREVLGAEPASRAGM